MDINKELVFIHIDTRYENAWWSSSSYEIERETDKTIFYDTGYETNRRKKSTLNKPLAVTETSAMIVLVNPTGGEIIKAVEEAKEAIATHIDKRLAYYNTCKQLLG